VRAALCAPFVALLTVGFGIVSALAALAGRRGPVQARLARTWAKSVLTVCGVQVRVSGGENVPAGPAVYAANHGSALDIPVVLGHLPADFRVIHKRSLYVLPVVGLHLYLAGHVGIDRGNPFRARRSLERAAERIRGGTSVVVFPEGTRSRDEAVRAFKRGPFVLAAKAEVPVVPLSLVGVKRVVPGGLIGLRPGTVELRIHPPLATSGRPARDAAALAAEVRQIVARGCGQA
jgi:1-acyl-sn-glycerol-3-phosphate acyltransferase